MSSSAERRMRRASTVATLIAVAAAALYLCGCATTDENEMPWNSPQPWEGSPAIPGLTPEY